MTTEIPADLATQLVEEWAADRLTQPTAAERDFAAWIVEQLNEDPAMATAKAALDSWWGRIRHLQAALDREAVG
jgi:hypothetical protein